MLWFLWNKKRVVKAGNLKLVKLVFAKCWDVDWILKDKLQSHLLTLEIRQVPWKFLVFLVSLILTD